MSNGAALDALTTPPPAAPTSRRHVLTRRVPAGASSPRSSRKAGRAAATTSPPSAARRELNPRRYGAPKRHAARLEGFLFPATYELPTRRDARGRSCASSSTASRSNIATVDMRRARTKNLTAYDVLTIASMIEREVAACRASARSSPAVIYNRLKAGHPARHRRDDPLRRRQLDRAADASPSSSRDTPYNTRMHRGPAADADRQPGPRVDRGGREPGRDDVPLLRRQAGDLRRARFAATDAEFQKRRRAPTTRKRAELGGKDPLATAQ